MATIGDKSVQTLGKKMDFWAFWTNSTPLPNLLKQCWCFYFFDCTDRSANTTLNWGAGGISELTLDANKLEQVLKCGKPSFPQSVSATFVTHCRFVSGQDESNPALLSATQTGKMELSCSLGTTRRVPKEKFPQKPYNKSVIYQACSAKMTWYCPRSLLRVYEPCLRLGQ